MQNPFLYLPMAQWVSVPAYIRWSGQPLIAPFYHVVADEPLPHIRHLYRPRSTKEFEKDLDTFLKHYRPVSVDELSGKLPEGNCFLLSFDDGLRQFHDFVAPILLRKGIPCICFLNSAFLDNRELFYRFKESLLADALKARPQKGLPAPEEILRIPYKDRSLLDKWALQAGVDFEAYLREERPYMTREEIRSLAQKGFRFGGHSIDHPRYSEISPKERLRQTRVSCSVAAEISSGNRLYFSFPHSDDTIPATFFAEIRDKVEYTFGTAGLKQDSVPRHLQRIPMEQGTLTANEILKNEYAYYLLKKPLFKNRINRK